MSQSPWSPYRPSPTAPWNLARAWTLRRRAGFAATWGELQRDLAAATLADRVLLMAFSEFGRRPAENGSLGTDHGTAAPVFLAGPSLRAGLIGETPRPGELVDGDLKWSTDFRRVYATLLDRWLGVPAETVLGQRFEPLPVLKGRC
jgi:uncharacterized protein (DUF1501 family)